MTTYYETHTARQVLSLQYLLQNLQLKTIGINIRGWGGGTCKKTPRADKNHLCSAMHFSKASKPFVLISGKITHTVPCKQRSF